MHFKKTTALCKRRISTINVFKLGEETHIHYTRGNVAYAEFAKYF